MNVCNYKTVYFSIVNSTTWSYENDLIDELKLSFRLIFGVDD